MHAGHYHSAKQYPEIRFNEDNVNGQCEDCNIRLYGNFDNYTVGLQKKIGSERMQAIDDIISNARRTGFKWDRISLIDIINKYKNL